MDVPGGLPPAGARGPALPVVPAGEGLKPMLSGR